MFPKTALKYRGSSRVRRVTRVTRQASAAKPAPPKAALADEIGVQQALQKVAQLTTRPKAADDTAVRAAALYPHAKSAETAVSGGSDSSANTVLGGQQADQAQAGNAAAVSGR
jgi:hypothetical protein